MTKEQSQVTKIYRWKLSCADFSYKSEDFDMFPVKSNQNNSNKKPTFLNILMKCSNSNFLILKVYKQEFLKNIIYKEFKFRLSSNLSMIFKSKWSQNNIMSLEAKITTQKWWSQSKSYL